MFFIRCDRSSRACVGEGHVRSGGVGVRSAGGREALRWFAVVAAAATLAACAQPHVVADRSASHAGSRHASSGPGRHAAVAAKRTSPANASAAAAQGSSYGLASYYTYDPKTASGEKFDSRELTAAHRTLPFGTRVRVTNVATGQSVTVRVNDRGPFVPGRVVDISRGAAETLGIVDRGVAKVKLDVVE